MIWNKEIKLALAPTFKKPPRMPKSSKHHIHETLFMNVPSRGV